MKIHPSSAFRYPRSRNRLFADFFWFAFACDPLEEVPGFLANRKSRGMFV